MTNGHGGAPKRVVWGMYMTLITGEGAVRIELDGTNDHRDPVALDQSEVIPFLPAPYDVEARVSGLSNWLRGCTVEEELAVATKAAQWARSTGMTLSRRRRWRERGWSLDWRPGGRRSPPAGTGAAGPGQGPSDAMPAEPPRDLPGGAPA